MIVTVFDCETTGLFYSGLIDDDKKPELTEFMAIKYDLDEEKIIKEFDFLVKPKRGIPKEITKITGLTDDMLKDALPVQARIKEIREALETSDAVIAHNLSYDVEMIETEFSRCGETINWPRKICTIEQTICVKGYRLSLTDLHKELMGEPFSGAHRARQDVEALLRCVKVLNIRGFI
jgi:DNA polymerase III epsilon subunit-like protein